ncbi:MAG TPA: formate dehydrogenase subunit gamma [Steroidobacteraceae bacterium]|nr:formate dehydrogenase subunit gamma [Steroidobacteraceae bacterium]
MTREKAFVERSVDAAIARTRNEPGPLLEILHSVQHDLGCVPPESVPLIADALNLSRAEVHGVVSFYHHFRERPAGTHTLQLCRAEACQSMNGDALADFARRRLQLDFGETRADGKVTLEAVYCLGNCACAPSAMIDGQLRGRVDAQAIAECAAGWGVPE